VLKERCRAFREEFLPGQTDGHGGECPDCRQWSQDIERLRACGANLPLPGELRSRLEQMPAGHGQQNSGPVLGRLPQVPLPAALMATLYRIPAETQSRRAPNPGFARTGEMVAASLLFSALLTLGLGGKVFIDGNRLPPNLSRVSTVAAKALRQAGEEGNQTLLGAGESIVRGCVFANRSLERLIERMGTPGSQPSPNPPPPSAVPGAPPQPSRPENKETPHGSHPAR
jgi:hypothetical protein